MNLLIYTLRFQVPEPHQNYSNIATMNRKVTELAMGRLTLAATAPSNGGGVDKLVLHDRS